MDEYRTVAELIKERAHVVAFTGAGISVDSGIPAFRGGQGLWEKYDPMEYAHIRAFETNPKKVWTMLREMSNVLFQAAPNAAHKALATLEKKGYLTAVITQNVDGLHQVSGNSTVIEYHGNHRWLTCPSCFKREPLTRESMEAIPYPLCTICDTALKPDVVFFGEAIPLEALAGAEEYSSKCKVMIIIGTSGVVYPAAEMPYLAKSRGAKIIEINMEETPFTSSITDHFFEGNASLILPEILKYL